MNRPADHRAGAAERSPITDSNAADRGDRKRPVGDIRC